MTEYEELKGISVQKYLSKQVGEDDNHFSKSTSGKNIAKSTSKTSMMSKFKLKPSIKLSGSNICRGITTEKDSNNGKFQSNLSLYIEYCYVPHCIDKIDQNYIPTLIKCCNKRGSISRRQLFPHGISFE